MSPVQPARIDYVPAFPAIQFTQRALLHPPREGRHEPQRVAGEGIADATVLPVRIGGAIRDKPSFPPRISANSAVKPQALFAPNKPFESLKLAIAGQSQVAHSLPVRWSHRSWRLTHGSNPIPSRCVSTAKRSVVSLTTVAEPAARTNG
jgi:hypothetical protein